MKSAIIMKYWWVNATQYNIQVASPVGFKDNKYIPTNGFESAYKPPKIYGAS